MELKKLSRCSTFSDISNIFIPPLGGHEQIEGYEYIKKLGTTGNTWLVSLAISFLLESNALDLIYLKEGEKNSFKCYVDNTKRLIFLELPNKSFMNSIHTFEKFHSDYGIIAKKLIEYKNNQNDI